MSSRYFDPIVGEDGLEVECSVHLCTETASWNDEFDEPLCLTHQDEYYDELAAEAMVDRHLEALATEERFMNTGSPYRVW